MLELVQEDKLVEQDLAQDDQLSAAQPLNGDLPAPLKDPFEQTVERPNGLAAELVKDAAHLDTGVVIGITTRVRGDEDAVARFAGSLQSRITVVTVAQQKTDFGGEFAQQQRGDVAIIGVGAGQFGCQRNPHRIDRSRQMQLPAHQPW